MIEFSPRTVAAVGAAIYHADKARDPETTKDLKRYLALARTVLFDEAVQMQLHMDVAWAVSRIEHLKQPPSWWRRRLWMS